MADIYETTLNKYRGSAAVVVIFLGALLMFAIGLNHFVEDTLSSKYGLESLERAYHLNLQFFDWSYWTMSLAPQIASIVFFYIFLGNTKNKWTLLVSLGSQFMDFFADSWYRSAEQLFRNWEVAGVASLLTFVYFSIGSEVFVSVGGGLLIRLFVPFYKQVKQVIAEAQRAGLFEPDKKPQFKPEQKNHFPVSQPQKAQNIQNQYRPPRQDKFVPQNYDEKVPDWIKQIKD